MSLEPAMEEKVRAAIIDELKRQAEIDPDKLEVTTNGDRVSVKGEVDVDALVMVIAGSIAGGP